MNGRFESIDSAFLSAPPVPRIGSSGKKTMRSLQGDAPAQARRRSAFQCRLIPILPSHTLASLFRIRSMIGVPRIGKRGLGKWLVAGRSRSPNPAAGRKRSSGYSRIFTSLSPADAGSTKKPDRRDARQREPAREEPAVVAAGSGRYFTCWRKNPRVRFQASPAAALL